MSRITVLCGGVGAARFLRGLVAIVDPSDVTAIVNVGDDAEFHGLRVSPDIDTVLYTLAGIVNEQHGWGIRDETWHVQEALARLGRDTWFQLGDADLATHIHRTALLRSGVSLTDVTSRLASALGVGARILPASDAPQATMVRTDDGWLAFQDYFVRRRQRDTVREVRFDGSRVPAPGVIAAIGSASIVIVAPSNPIVSIGPILALDGVRDALARTAAQVVAVSPIIAGEAVKGPAAAMLASLGHQVSAAGVARLYADFLDVLVIDERDAELAPAVEKSGPRAVVAPTLMVDAPARARLARATLDAVSSDARA
ncbi:MAG TPA: 2-phospho-L-lactate transferase [Candidatus Acidoferrales bacterium]|nr:2-phospho-L-lactate transferase [Candidatus Acidoferrales bacterium]